MQAIDAEIVEEEGSGSQEEAEAVPGTLDGARAEGSAPDPQHGEGTGLAAQRQPPPTPFRERGSGAWHAPPPPSCLAVAR